MTDGGSLRAGPGLSIGLSRLHVWAGVALRCADPGRKVCMVRALQAARLANAAGMGTRVEGQVKFWAESLDAAIAACCPRFSAGVTDGVTTERDDGPEPILDPGRPALPELVPPRALSRRSPTTQLGRLVLAHAVAHIEFNAINIALDAVYRFRDLPLEFHADWLKVAAEEAEHFTLLTGYLARYGHAYGDWPAHDGLWRDTVATAHDPLVCPPARPFASCWPRTWRRASGVRSIFWAGGARVSVTRNWRTCWSLS